MLVRILSGFEPVDGVRVLFSSAFGEGCATWSGDSPRGLECDVELSVREELWWGRSVKKGASRRGSFLLEDKGDRIRLHVQFDRAEMDGSGVCYFRLGTSLFSGIVQGAPLEPGTWVVIEVRELFIADTRMA
jgi:hypothetical protein